MAINDVNQTELVLRAAAELKKDAHMKAPAWAPFVKTGHSRERQPMQPDWWHTRAASVLRRVALFGPIGTSKLKRKYGGRKNMGMAPERFMEGGGSIIREILQQLEKAGLAKQTAKGVHKGRVVTPKGQALLEAAAVQLIKEQGIVLAKPVTAEQLAAAEEKAKEDKKAAKAPRKKSTAPRKKKAEEAPVAAPEAPAAQ